MAESRKLEIGSPSGLIPELIQVALHAKNDNLVNGDALLTIDEVIREMMNWIEHEAVITEDGIIQLLRKLEVLSRHETIKRDNLDKLTLMLREFVDKDLAGYRGIEVIQAAARELNEARKQNDKKPKKKIAFVDIDGTLIKRDGSINLKLIEQLKQFDEVVLFTQRNNWLQLMGVTSKLAAIEGGNPTPQFITIEHVLAALHAHGLHNVKVSTTLDHSLEGPLTYYDSELREFERIAYRAGLEVRREGEYTEAFAKAKEKVTAENSKVRVALGVQTDPQTREGQPDRYYPHDKVAQYKNLVAFYRERYGIDPDVTVFDDVRDNLTEILDEDSVLQKPVACLVDYHEIHVLLVSIDRLDSAKYARFSTPNYAQFIDYFIMLQKLNNEHPQNGEINLAADFIIHKLLSIKTGAEITSALDEIMIPLSALSDMKELMLPDAQLTPNDLFNAIRGRGDGSPKSQQVVAALKSELEPLNDYRMPIEVKITKNLTLGSVHVERLLPEGVGRLRDFISDLPEGPVTDENIDAVVARLMEVLKLQDEFKKLGIIDSAPVFMQKLLELYIRENGITFSEFMRLKALDEYLEAKEDQVMQSRERQEKGTRYYQGLRFYIAGPGRLLDCAKDRFPIYEQSEPNFQLFKQFKFEEIHKQLKLQDIPKYIDAIFDSGSAESKNFKNKLYDYQIKHAYEIHQWQLDLHVPELPQNVRVAMESFPRDYMSYLQKYDNTEFLNLDAAIKFDKKYSSNANPNPLLADLISKAEKRYQLAKQEFRQNARQELIKGPLAKQVSDSTDNICEHFIKNIKFIIETTRWKAKGVGGTRIMIGNQLTKLPTNVAKIYALCLQAERKKDWKECFNEIAFIGKKASEPHTFDLFGLRKRDQLTQDFYNQFKEAFIEKNAALKRDKES